MADLTLIMAMGLITYASRAVLLVRSGPAPRGRTASFLEAFPLALFVALATTGLAAPDGHVGLNPGLAAAAGGLVGAVLTRRSYLGVIAVGGAAYFAATAFG